MVARKEDNRRSTIKSMQLGCLNNEIVCGWSSIFVAVLSKVICLFEELDISHNEIDDAIATSLGFSNFL